MRLPVRDNSIWFKLSVGGVDRGLTYDEFCDFYSVVVGEDAGNKYLREHGRIKKFGLWW